MTESLNKIKKFLVITKQGQQKKLTVTDKDNLLSTFPKNMKEKININFGYKLGTQTQPNA